MQHTRQLTFQKLLRYFLNDKGFINKSLTHCSVKEAQHFASYPAHSTVNSPSFFDKST
jgi:hypothetical protein